jgi:hypothetical protein
MHGTTLRRAERLFQSATHWRSRRSSRPTAQLGPSSALSASQCLFLSTRLKLWRRTSLIWRSWWPRGRSRRRSCGAATGASFPKPSNCLPPDALGEGGFAGGLTDAESPPGYFLPSDSFISATVVRWSGLRLWIDMTRYASLIPAPIRKYLGKFHLK